MVRGVYLAGLKSTKPTATEYFKFFWIAVALDFDIHPTLEAKAQFAVDDDN